MRDRLYPEGGPAADHDCMDHRERVVAGEGDDVLIERCAFCGRVRHETDGVRPMAWYVDRTNPTGHRYAYDPPHNDPRKPTVWRYPDEVPSRVLRPVWRRKA